MGAADFAAEHSLYPRLQVHSGEAAGVIEIGGVRFIQLSAGGTGDITALPDHVQCSHGGWGLGGGGGCLGGLGSPVRGGGTGGRGGLPSRRAGGQGKQQPQRHCQPGKVYLFHLSSPSSRYPTRWMVVILFSQPSFLRRRWMWVSRVRVLSSISSSPQTVSYR